MSDDAFIQITPDSYGKRIDNAVFLRDSEQIFRQRVEVYAGETLPVSGPVTDAQLRATPLPISGTVALGAGNYDASGRVRTSNLTTLFDGKILGNVEDTLKWHTVGTGSSSVANNSVTLSVTAGQYMIRQAKHWNPYYSGKPQMVEITGANFQYQTGVVKRFGYFSSSAVAPYTAELDGFYVESDGVNNTYRLVAVRNGTETHNIPWTSWDGYDLISGYDWSKFTVAEIASSGWAALRCVCSWLSMAPSLLSIPSPTMPARSPTSSS